MPIIRNPFEDNDHKEAIPTESLINEGSLEAQNKRLLDHLAAGNTINFLQARDMSIGFLNSRIADLRKQEVNIYSRLIRICNIQCKEYSLVPFIED